MQDYPLKVKDQKHLDTILKLVYRQGAVSKIPKRDHSKKISKKLCNA